MAVSANRLELLQIADAVAREKAIDRGIVIAAMEDAIQKAARSRYGSETEVRAEINPKTGKKVTPLELLQFARDDLKLDYIFWGNQEPYYSKEVIPALRSREMAARH